MEAGLRVAALALSLGSASAAPGVSTDRFPADPVPWSRVRVPTTGPAQVYGGTSAGCLTGAQALPEHDPTYQVTRPHRRRTFGHPDLVRYVRKLSRQVAKAKLGPLMVGDLSQPRGGPAPTGHASHQTGLDVDIWYVTPPEARRRALSEAERNRFEAAAVVDLATKRATSAWHPSLARVLALAAAAPEVDRIFVHARVKQLICDSVPTDRAWLAKLRPWWGHHDHFHVRLRCPTDSPHCEPQPPLGSEPGCDKLSWWISDESRAALERRKEARAKAEPTLPAACRDVLGPAPEAPVPEAPHR
ncbi:MAG: penicillin-insensitive murein endopeptidase [Myxococcales bacterium]|nr:penicillin-insensitive murein endopeptidase [Myxococcales bacterium]